MLKKLVMIRKHAGEEYHIYVNLPQYHGETGIFGLEQDAYVSIETPENCFGYSDTVLFDKRYGRPYTLSGNIEEWEKKHMSLYPEIKIRYATK